MLLDFVHEDFTSFGEDEHAALREGHLLNFCAPGQIADGVKIFAITVSYGVDFHGGQLGLCANVECPLLVDVSLVIPTECYVDDIW